MSYRKVQTKQQKGFTILELLIATTVFSMILLLVSNGVIQIGRLYYKGITTSKTQETTRAVSGEISRTLQLNNIDVDKPPSSDVICMGKSRYTYILDRRIDNTIPAPPNTTRHALWFDTARGPGEACDRVDLTQADPTPNQGRELLSTNMRLLRFDVIDLPGSSFNVNIRIGYGDDDLLTNYKDDGTPSGILAKDASCRSTNSGGSFCAVSQLDTTVQRRVN